MGLLESLYRSIVGEEIEEHKNVMVSPLHLAISNTRSVGVLLKYMANIDSCQWDIISD